MELNQVAHFALLGCFGLILLAGLTTLLLVLAEWYVWQPGVRRERERYEKVRRYEP